MRYAIATLISLSMILAGALLAGAGHGWIWGAVGSVALAPIAGFAWSNALAPTPSVRGAAAALASGLAVSIVVATATTFTESEHLDRYLRVNSTAGISVAGFVYLNWVFISLVAIARSRRVSRHVQATNSVLCDSAGNARTDKSLKR